MKNFKSIALANEKYFNYSEENRKLIENNSIFQLQKYI
jgi:hypothetical protein